MLNARLTISFRTRIIILVAGVVGLSVGVQAYFGARLFVEDKTSYLYQRDLTVLTAVADKIDTKISEVLAFNTFLGFLQKSETGGAASAQELFKANASRLSLDGYSLAEPGPDGRVLTLQSFGAGHWSVDEIFDSQGWSEASFAAGHSLVGYARGGVLPVVSRIDRRSAAPLYLVAYLRLDEAVFAPKYPEMGILLFAARGELLLRRSERVGEGTPGVPAYVESLLAHEGVAGVRKVTLDGREYLGGYRKISGGRLLAVSFVPSETTFLAARAMVLRAILIGFSIFLLAVGGATLLIRRLVQRLRQLWYATGKVASGDFSVRVAAGAGSDELDSLARSFNDMSARISGLLQETADKARMAKELETAQAVQSKFFPSRAFESPGLRVSGGYRPSSECAGDWWGYVARGDRVYVAIGDVTGHGVSSALVTAAAHGVFYEVLGGEAPEDGGDQLERLLHSLNRIVRAVGTNGAMMTFLALELDTRTGQGRFVNASHPTPWISRGGDLAAVGNFEALGADLTPPLGFADQLAVRINSFALGAGDRLVLCTDGFFEPRRADGRAMRKREFLKMVREVWEAATARPEEICEGVIGRAVEYLGEGSPPDDITFVMLEGRRAVAGVRPPPRPRLAA